MYYNMQLPTRRSLLMYITTFYNEKIKNPGKIV
jgi:hypothetical protein